MSAYNEMLSVSLLHALLSFNKKYVCLVHFVNVCARSNLQPFCDDVTFLGMHIFIHFFQIDATNLYHTKKDTS